MSEPDLFTTGDGTWFLRIPTDPATVYIGFAGESERIALPVSDLFAYVAHLAPGHSCDRAIASIDRVIALCHATLRDLEVARE